MFAIYKRELKSFFSSMIGWLFLAVNLFFAAWYFRYYGMLNGLPYVSYVFSGILLIFLFSMPILTMKVFADEMKQKTDQLLFTSPVPVWKIVLAKYLSLVTVFAIPIVLIGLYPMILSIYGEVPYGENYLAIFGFFMFGCACLAIGLFMSSITESQIIAAVLTFFSLLLTAMIPGICNLISANGNILTDILGAFDMTGYLDYYLYGIFYYPSVLYYISVIFICLYLTGFIITKKRFLPWHRRKE